MTDKTDIQLIDDRPENLEVLSKMLSKKDYRVRTFTNGELALASAFESPPDLILLDIMMPGMDGYEVCRCLKADERTRNIPVLFLSALNDAEDKVKAFAAGGVDFITKPFQEEELLVRVATHLALRNVQKQLEAQNARMQAVNQKLSREIAGRKQADEMLRESEERLRGMFEAMAEGIIFISSDGRIVTANPAAERILGLKRSDVQARNYITPEWEIIRLNGTPMPPEEWPGAQAMKEKRLVKNVEMGVNRPDGTVSWINVSAAPLMDKAGQLEGIVGTFFDITEHKQAEESLRHSRDRFRQVVISISDHIYVTAVAADGHKTNLYISPNIEALTGYPLGKFLEDWSFWGSTVIHPDDRAIAARQAKKLVGGEANEVEYRLVRADNKVIWVRDSGRVVEENGSRTIYGVVSNITRRKRADEEIRHQNRELTLLNQIIMASATDLEPEAVLETACCELAMVLDLPQAAIALLNEEKTAAVVIAEYLAEGRPPALHNTIPVTGNPSLQYLLKQQNPLAIDDAQHDPRLAPIHHLMRERETASILLLPLTVAGEVVGSLGLDALEPRHFSTEEISLAWSVADQLAGVLTRLRSGKTHQLLITAIEQTAECVIITDVDGTIRYVNSAFEQVTGYSRAEAVGQNPRILNSGQQDGTFYQDMWAAISAGQIWQGQFVNQKKDGTFYTEEAVINPLRDKHGHISNYVAVKRNVTRELELEAQLRQAHKMEAIGRLAGGVAHDFNNLLTIISGHTEFLLSRYPNPGDPRREEAEQIKKAGEQATALTRQLLTFSRQQPLQPQILDLNQMVANLKKMLPRLIGEDVNLITNLAPNLGQIKADPSQIEQILMNLAVNARDAMPRGGKLTIKTARVDLDEAYARQHLDLTPGPYIMLTIADTGQGMDAETRSHIFEPFFTTKGVGKGTGLGLSTVYGIVEQSDGHIQVDSIPGQGTTFRIYLPWVEQTGESAALPQDPTTSLGGQETILLVEDEAGVRLITRKFLEKRGYTVLEAEHGEEALQLCRQHAEQIDLLITDVIMPDISGPELARQLIQFLPTLNILYVSGYADEVLEEHKIPNLKFVLLEKPFSSDALGMKVRQILERS